MARLMLEEKQYQQLDKKLKERLVSRVERSTAPVYLFLLAKSAVEQDKSGEARGYLEEIRDKYPDAPNKYVAQSLLKRIELSKR